MRMERGEIDAVIARAAPPPERADERVFEPVATAADALARRRERLTAAFGSRAALDAHAEALGLTPDAWLDRFRDVRLAGPDPDWARAFQALLERLSDGPQPFDEVRRRARAEVEAAWPEGLPRGPDALDGPLDRLTRRLRDATGPSFFVEKRLGARPPWAVRFRRSPALAWALGRLAADWHADVVRTLRRAAADRALLTRRVFGGADPGALTAVEAGLGDPHAGGQSVAILRFERGAVVYKPKDLRIAAAVGDLARELGGGLAPPDPIARDGYAWEPVHAPRPVADAGEADAFFGALGGWLALLQTLGGNDFWLDNLIADGPTPRFIDFETAVQPPPDWPDGIRPLDAAASAAVRAGPLGVRILPSLIRVADGEDAADIGCLARPGPRRTPRTAAEGGGPVSWRADDFAPHYADGTPADAADHFDAFEAGYLRAARALAEPPRQARVVDRLRQAADARVRIIRVDTWTGYRAIRQSHLPRHLSDGVWREIALHAVFAGSGEVVGPLREAAVRDLRRGDIPLFRTRLGSRDLRGVEDERHADFFDRDALDGVRSALGTLAGLADEERIAWLRSGFGCRQDNPARRRPSRARVPPARPGDLLEWADEIASAVTRRTVRDERGAPTWFGLVHDVFCGVRFLGPLDFDVLSGRAGLALALRELAAGLERPDLAALARETLAGAGRDWIDYAERCLRGGAGHVVGAGGLVAALAGDPALRPLAREVFDCASSHDVCLRSGADFVSGLAGWRAAAAALGEPAPSRHGPDLRYAPSSHARLARWLDPQRAAPLCPDRLAAARRRRDRDRHGSWFAAAWLDDRHNLSGIDGLPALAVRFLHLARGAPARRPAGSLPQNGDRHRRLMRVPTD